MVKYCTGFLVILILVLNSCSNYNEIGSTLKEKTGQTDNNQGIVFINLEISANVDNPSGLIISYIGSVIKKGKLKKDLEVTEIIRPGMLFCSLLSNTKDVIRSFTIENPLNKYFEHFDEKGNAYIEQVERDLSLFSIRTNYSTKIQYLKIQKILSGGKFEHIVTIEL